MLNRRLACLQHRYHACMLTCHYRGELTNGVAKAALVIKGEPKENVNEQYSHVIGMPI